MEILLNWLWQGAVVAAATAIVLATIPPSMARTRHAVAWASLVSVLALPLVLAIVSASPEAGDGGALLAAGPSPLLPAIPVPQRWWMSGAVIGAAWAAWAAINAVRLVMATVVLRRMKRSCRPLR